MACKNNTITQYTLPPEVRLEFIREWEKRYPSIPCPIRVPIQQVKPFQLNVKGRGKARERKLELTSAQLLQEDDQEVIIVDPEAEHRGN